MSSELFQRLAKDVKVLLCKCLSIYSGVEDYRIRTPDFLIEPPRLQRLVVDVEETLIDAYVLDRGIEIRFFLIGE